MVSCCYSTQALISTWSVPIAIVDCCVVVVLLWWVGGGGGGGGGGGFWTYLLCISTVDPVIPESVPVLVLWGTRDFALSYWIAENSVNKYTKNGRLVPLDATHWITHDLPEETAQRLVNFFEEK